MRALAALVLVVLPLTVLGCGGPKTAAAVADPAPKGVEVDRTVTGPEEVLKFQGPEGIDAGLTDAVHKIGEPVNYTIYMYDSPDAAKAALAIWDKGLVGTEPPFMDVLLSLPGPDALGPGSLHLQTTDGTVHRFVGQGGPFVVVTIGDDEEAAKDTANELYARLPK